MQICPFFGNLCNLSYTKRNPQWTSIGNLPPITVPCASLTMIMWSSLKTWVKKVKNFSKWLILNNSYLMTYGTGIWILTDQKKCLGNQKKKINFWKKKNQSFFLLLNYQLILFFFSEEITAKYFGQLSDDDIHKLYGIYQDDFNLFDYRFNFRNISLPLKWKKEWISKLLWHSYRKKRWRRKHFINIQKMWSVV